MIAGPLYKELRRRSFVNNNAVIGAVIRRRRLGEFSTIRYRLFSSSSSTPPPPPSSVSNNPKIPASHPGVGTFMKRSDYLKEKGINNNNNNNSKEAAASGKLLFLRAGLPFLLFSLGAWWVVASAIDGKLKERAAARREVSLSERQMLMEEEHDDMMTKLNKAAKADFDNTKRIERPEEILKRRKAEREKRNVWYRRWWRSIKGEA